MKTTQLIDLLKKYECGAVTGRPREVYFEVGDEIIKTDGIEVIGSGDGLVTDLFLSLPDLDAVPVVRCKDCKHKYIENMTWHCPFGLMGGEDFFCGYGSLGRAERRSDEKY